MRACTFFSLLALVLAGCGDRSFPAGADLGTPPPGSDRGEAGGGACGDLGAQRSGQFPPGMHEECRGNVGCRQIAYQCGCHCVLCEDERCLSVICDDTCMMRLDLGVDQRVPEQGISPDLAKDALPQPDVGCTVPVYSQDCSQVPHFDCGFSAICSGSTVKVSWHEHIFCEGQEQVQSYTCSYSCAGTCVSTTGWPKDGADLVQMFCQP
jgi:hypothetical protein